MRLQNAMASAKESVRVFISSNFRDMHAERDHLVTVVFPELRERVEQLGLEFFDVDLRWGVPAKDLSGDRQLMARFPGMDRPDRSFQRLHPRSTLRLDARTEPLPRHHDSANAARSCRP